MKPVSVSPQRPAAPVWFAPLLAVIFIFLFIRNSGVYPIAFVDEWVYSSGARLLPAAQAEVPSYLYFWLYKLTLQCGDSFLDCNRMFNVLLFVLAAPCIYLMARRHMPAWVAALVAAVAMFGPNNAYTPFFMPEAIYFCAFWAFSCLVMTYSDAMTTRRALAIGVALGLTALIKLHGLFLAPALAVFLFYLAYADRGDAPASRWLLRGLLWTVAAAVATLATRMAVGYLLAGKNGLSLLGSLYSGQAAYTAKTHYPLPMLLQFAWHNMQGHLMLLGLMFGVPLAVLLTMLPGAVRAARGGDPATRRMRALTVYTILMLGSVLAVTVAFTASITGLAVTDSTARIHTRYYNFALPLLMVFAAAAWQAPQVDKRQWPRLLVGALLLVLIWHARAHLLHRFAPGIIDSPDLLAVSYKRSIFNVVTGLALLASLAWMVRPLLGLRLFVLLALPLATLGGSLNINKYVRYTIWPDHYSKAGLFARHYLDRGETDQLVIVANDIGGLHRTRFFVENPNSAFMQVQPGQQPDWSQLPGDKQWVLVIGQYAPPPQARVVARKDEMMLFQMPRSAAGKVFTFDRPLTGMYVARAMGLAGPEPWGSWSDGPQVEIEFTGPLPKHLTLAIKGRAFGPNIGRDITVSIGGQQRTMQLGAESSQVTLPFDTDGTATTLRFTIPAPTTPKSLGQGEDLRAMGIGFESLKIDSAESVSGN